MLESPGWFIWQGLLFSGEFSRIYLSHLDIHRQKKELKARRVRWWQFCLVLCLALHKVHILFEELTLFKRPRNKQAYALEWTEELQKILTVTDFFPRQYDRKLLGVYFQYFMCSSFYNFLLVCSAYCSFTVTYMSMGKQHFSILQFILSSKSPVLKAESVSAVCVMCEIIARGGKF